MRKTILSVFILTLLTLTQLATADFTVSNDSNTTVMFSLSRYLNAGMYAGNSYPAGWWTQGWYQVLPGATETFIVPAANNANVFLHVIVIRNAPSEVKPTDHASRVSGGWLIHTTNAFIAVEKADGSGTLLKSDQPANQLIRKHFYGYPNGSFIRISADGRLLVGTDARVEEPENITTQENRVETNASASGTLTEQQMRNKLDNVTLISGLNIPKGDIFALPKKDFGKNAFKFYLGRGKNRFVLLEQFSSTCGTTSTEMVLRYYGQDVGQAEIWGTGGIHIIATGAFPAELEQALDRLGVRARWYPGYPGSGLKHPTLNDLKSWVRENRPPIVLLRFDDYLHYVVVVGYDNQGDFLLADPNGKFCWMSSDDLAFGWSLDAPGLPNTVFETKNGFEAFALKGLTEAADFLTGGQNVIVPFSPPSNHLPGNYSVPFKVSLGANYRPYTDSTGEYRSVGVAVRGGNRFNPTWTTDRWEETFTFPEDIADYRVSGVVPAEFENLGGLEPAYIQGHQKVNNRTVRVWGRITPGRVTKGRIYVFVRGFKDPIHGANTVSSTQSKRYSSKWGIGSDKPWHTFTFPEDVLSYTISAGIDFEDRWGAELLEHHKTGNQVKFRIRLDRHKIETNSITVNVTAHHEPLVAGDFQMSSSGSLSNIPSGQNRTITVKVLTTKGHPMPGVRVQFSDTDDSEIAFSPTSATTNSSGIATSTMKTGSHGSADFNIMVAGLSSKRYTVSVARVLKEHVEKRWFSSRDSGEDCRRVFGVKICTPDLTPDWYTASEHIDVPSWVSIHSYSISTHVPVEDLATKPSVKQHWRSGNRVHLRIRFREHVVESNDILVRVHAKYWGTERSPGAPLNPEIRPDPDPVTAAWQDLSYVPSQTTLLPNYPNPFNPETWIPYHLAESADVTLTIYSADGKLVRTLALGHQAAGIYENKSRAAYWDGQNAIGERVASGLYFYMLTAGDFAATGKMLIVK